MKLWLLLLLALPCLASFTQVLSSRYQFKGSPHNGPWPTVGPSSVQQLISTKAAMDVLLLSQMQLWLWTGKDFVAVPIAGWSVTQPARMAHIGGDSFVVADATGVHWLSCSLAGQSPSCMCTSAGATVLDGVSSIAWDATHKAAFVGTKQGLFTSPFQSKTASLVPDVDAKATSSVVWSADGGLVVGQALKGYRRKGENWRFEWTDGLIDTNITAATFLHKDGQEAELWYGNDACVNIQRTGGLFDRVDGLKGLPQGNISAMTSTPYGAAGGVWIGSRQGSVSFYDVARGEWRYFFGPRWLPGGPVVDVAIFADNGVNASVAVATTTGLAILDVFPWTLEDKAAYYETLVVPRHDRYGLVADCSLRTFGDVTSYEQHPNDNDGLWTSVYLGSQIFKYATTKDPQAKANAWRHYKAMELLNHATGIPGLMARSVVKRGTDPGSGTWHNSTALPDWTWKGDTSSDEVCGHMYVYPLMHDLVAETPEEKKEVKQLFLNIIDYIMKNNWTLVDITGKPTTWGLWDPQRLNYDIKYYDERGLNSLQILSWLAQANAMTGDEKYMRAFDELAQKHGYLENMLNQKITVPDDDNFSDDELAHLPYFTFLHALHGGANVSEAAQSYLKRSLARTWSISAAGHSSLWTVISAIGLGESAITAEEWQHARDNLHRWPVELVAWPTKNSDRIDLRHSPYLDRFGRAQDAVEYIAPDESNFLRWNADPHAMDGGSGRSEGDPGAPLLAYWMGRYYGFY